MGVRVAVGSAVGVRVSDSGGGSEGGSGGFNHVGSLPMMCVLRKTLLSLHLVLPRSVPQTGSRRARPREWTVEPWTGASWRSSLGRTRADSFHSMYWSTSGAGSCRVPCLDLAGSTVRFVLLTFAAPPALPLSLPAIHSPSFPNRPPHLAHLLTARLLVAASTLSPTLTAPCTPRRVPRRPQLSCHITRTTPETHKLIRDNLHETPKYGGWLPANGPRYCPSIEDKIVRFADKESHQIFLEVTDGITSISWRPGGLFGDAAQAYR